MRVLQFQQQAWQGVLQLIISDFFQHAASCFIFQAVSDGIAHIVATITGIDPCNYLDDFLWVTETKQDCINVLKTFTHICDQIGMPIAHEKTEQPTQELTFLGMVINTSQQLIKIKEDKRNKALTELDSVICSRKVTVLKLQQLTGTLNFMGRAIIPG